MRRFAENKIGSHLIIHRNLGNENNLDLCCFPENVLIKFGTDRKIQIYKIYFCSESETRAAIFTADLLRPSITNTTQT